MYITQIRSDFSREEKQHPAVRQDERNQKDGGKHLRRSPIFDFRQSGNRRRGLSFGKDKMPRPKIGYYDTSAESQLSQ